MNSKRQLYKPASKQNVGQKKGRKLVQGTLVSSSNSNGNSLINDNGAGVIDEDTMTRHCEKDIGSTSSQVNHDTIIARSVASDVQDDPSMSPCRAVPALTEFLSPRAEPPSQCLNLSDTELNLSEATSVNTSRQQPIMVCDASHLGSSPDNTEVEVLVEYEDSPARVICHTPSRSDKSPRSALNQSPPQRATASTGRRGPISLVFSSPKACGDSSIACSDSGSECISGHNLICLDNDDDNESKRKLAVKKKNVDSPLISKHSRGIIKEILAEEIGSQDVSLLSLYSHESPPTSQGLLRSLSPAEMHKHYPTPVTSVSNCSRSKDIIIVNDMSSNFKDIPKPIFSMVNYANESDASVDNGNKTGKDRIDRTTKIEAAKKAEMLKHQNDSDSETCSLYEYVAQKKTRTNSVKEIPQGLRNTQNNSLDIAKKPRSAKKKPGRVVASRYMQNAGSVAQKSNPSLHSTKDLTLSSSRSQINLTKPKIKTAKTSLRSTVSVNRLLDATKNNYTPASMTSANVKSSSKKDRFTSTPTKNDSCSPCEIDVSNIHPSRTMVIGDKDSVEASQSSAEKITPFQLDIQYVRYLQALYLSRNAKRSSKEQEKQAMDQLHGLWQLHEKKRGEVSKLKIELERLKGLSQIDAALDVTESRLSSLEEKLPQVGVYYSNLGSALNNTLHQITTKNIHIPNKTEEEREAYEDKLETTLRQSEHLLNAITSKTGHTFPPLHQYVASLEAISLNVEDSGSELRDGYKDLEVAHGLCSRLSSGMVMTAMPRAAGGTPCRSGMPK